MTLTIPGLDTGGGTTLHFLDGAGDHENFQDVVLTAPAPEPEPEPVPEPAAATLLAAGLAGLGVWRRRRD
jgi:hypothetical protein